jgi:hypothetical protein
VQQAFEQLGLGVTHRDAERPFAVVVLFVEVVHGKFANHNKGNRKSQTILKTQIPIGSGLLGVLLGFWF